MAITVEEIRAALAELAFEWQSYSGNERQGAQLFLTQLLACYGETVKPEQFETFQAGGFVDLKLGERCIFEMKAPTEANRLAKHREQALGYWDESSDREKGVRAAQFVVICAFQRMEIWEPGAFRDAPVATLELAELPERYDALLFLSGNQPVFRNSQVDLTKDAVVKVAALHNALADRHDDLDEVRDFMFQCVWCMFAEDVGLLPVGRFSELVTRLLADPTSSSVDVLGQLFDILDKPGPRPEKGHYAGTPYANGGLFREPAKLDLNEEELELLADAARSNWSQVEPAVFGGLLEGGLGHEQQWHLGAHYTHLREIDAIVRPCIVDPWNERIADAKTYEEATKALQDLHKFVVLDPACGSGNFLYVAYRALRRIENRLMKKLEAMRVEGGMPETLRTTGYFPLSNIKGIEIDNFAVKQARLALWMGHKLSVDELNLPEAPLPLTDLSGIRRADALAVEWPRADVIIGNPPFHGAKLLRRELGDPYVEWLKKEFGIGLKDFCVYWFRKSHDHLEPGKRAGLIGTNSISQNTARKEGLQYIVENGGIITDAVSTEVWPGDANVHFSLVNWIKDAPLERPPVLDGEELNEPITASLRPLSLSVDRAVPLKQNALHAFIGPIPGASGFTIKHDEAKSLIDCGGDSWTKVIRPYLVGDDIQNSPGSHPSRWIIDFGFMSLEDASKYDRAIEIVRERVKPSKDLVAREQYRKHWWRFHEPIVEMRKALEPLSRYVAAPAQSKRIAFSWQDIGTCPSNLTVVLAFDDDYSMGVLLSRLHVNWATASSSTIKGDPRYTPTTAFATFPWPDPTDESRSAIEKVSAELVARRAAISTDEKLGLTAIYNAIEEGGFEDLAKLHLELDQLVTLAYGWPKSIAQDAAETNRRLLALNLAIGAGEARYNPFGDGSGE